MKTLKAKQCTVAGTTSDGKVCYFGKKESDDPYARDLTFWITVGLPRKDGENYCRVEKFGFDHEAYATMMCSPYTSDIKGLNERIKEFYEEFLAGLTAAEIQKHEGDE